MSDFLAMLGDARLPGDARVLGLFVMQMGEGWHEVPHMQFRALLSGGPSDETVRRHVRTLEGSGWLESDHNTGRRPPRYRIIPRCEAGAFGGIRDALAESLTCVLPHNGVGETDSLPHKNEGLGIATPQPCGGEGRMPHTVEGQSPPSSSPLPLPPPVTTAGVRAGGLHPDAARVIDAADGALNGCRGSLRDYLAERVDPERQHAYVQRVVTALQGADEWMWKDRSGHTLHDGRTKVLAASFNELLAGDETGKHFAEPPGGYGNLRSKVRYLVASSLGVDSDATKATRPTPAPTPTPPRRRTPSVRIES